MKFSIKTCVFLVLILSIGCSNEPKEAGDDKASTIDQHSFANTKEAIVTHISLNLAVDFDSTLLKGSATLTFDNLAQAKELILDTKDLIVSKVTIDQGQSTTFSFGEEHPIFGASLH
ncbi:MAG: hypothetical protein ABF321_03440, partial [Bacteroidia bacterium]